MTIRQMEPSLDHLEWLIDARGRTNKAALLLLALFELYPEKIRTLPHSPRAQQLVSISFSLWRAAFLADRKGRAKGLAERKIADAEQFLRKILVDNQIGFAQDRSWREWSFHYYLDNAYSRLMDLQCDWDNLDLGELWPEKGKRTTKNRWNILNVAFEQAVEHLEKDLGGYPDG